MRKRRENLRENFKLLEEKQETTNRGITLIALVVTIVVLLILASVSITVVFGDNGILQLAKEAGEKTNEAVQNDKENIGNMTDYIKSLNWDASKVTAVITKDGGIVPVPKGFVGSEVDGENTIKDGFVIYEGEEPVTDDNVETARTEKNQFVWVPADGVSLEYKQDKETWASKTYWYNECKDHWTDNEKLEERKASVKKYGGFYVGRYEAGIEESIKYTDQTDYQRSESNKDDTSGTPVTKKNRQAWNFVTQTAAKTLSEKMYSNSTTVTSRLMDSYAWDTICKWFENDKIDVIDSTSWGNYYDASYIIEGLYAMHIHSDSGWILATKYSKTDEKSPFLIPSSKSNNYYEVATGVTVVDETGKEIDRNKAKNIYDFAGNMWEWTTETEEHDEATNTEDYTKGTGIYAIPRGGCLYYSGKDVPAVRRQGNFGIEHCGVDVGFRPVLYIN